MVANVIDDELRTLGLHAEDNEFGMTIIEIEADRKCERRNGVDDIDDVTAVLADIVKDDLVSLVIGLRPYEFVVQRH